MTASMVSQTVQRKLEKKKFENWINWINRSIAVFLLLFVVDRGECYTLPSSVNGNNHYFARLSWRYVDCSRII